jgi:hypothetical protein
LKKYKNDICAYCGSSDDLDEDHIPPKNLFPKPRPNNLLKVQACPKCHSSQASRDDEYFRIKVCLRDDVGRHESARSNWDAIFRSLKRNEAAGLKNSIISDTMIVELKSPSGLYLGRRLAYNVDMNRICRVIERISRGLYFVESQKILGLENEVCVYANEDFKLETKDFINQFTNTILVPLSNTQPKIIGNNVFEYRYQIVKENPLFSVWWMSFYGCVPFLTMTRPKMKSQ